MSGIMRTVVKVRLTRLQCQRCGHPWVPRTDDVRQCPRCKSARWEQPREKAREELQGESMNEAYRRIHPRSEQASDRQEA